MKITSPLHASWLTHGIGAIVALIIWLTVKKHLPQRTPGAKIPLWCYLGGIPGAFTVLLAASTVNSPLSLSGSIVLMLAGQIVTGLIIDHFGLMGLPQRKASGRDGLTNGICIIFSRSINGRLSQGSNAFYASLVNHVSGFIFLSVVVLFYLPQFPVTLNSIPLIAFTGVILILLAIGVRYRK